MSGSAPRLNAAMHRATRAAMIVWIGALAWVFARRVGFPLELEWMEGGVLHQAQRFALGEPIYPPPSIEFVPFLYTPLYSMVLGVLGLIFPLGFVLARVVSIVATIAIGLGIWRAVRQEGRPPAHAALGVALFASSYVFTFRWFDVGRPDSLHLALVVWALVLLRRTGQSTEARLARRRAIVAGLLMALAFWTKQTAALFVLGSGVGALLVSPRQLPYYAATIAVVDGGGVLVGNALTDGWLWTYIYELHQSHAFNRERFTTKTWGMFIHALPFVVLLVALRVGLLVGTVRSGLARVLGTWRLPAYWWLLAATGLLVSALGYSTQWAEPNAFMPGVAMLAIAIAVTLPAGGRAEVLTLGLGLAQLAFALAIEPRYQPIQDHGPSAWRSSYAWQDPARTIPGPKDVARATELRRELVATEGEMLALHRPWWSILAGGPGHVGSMGVSDMPKETERQLRSELRDSVRARRWAVIWLEGDPPPWLRGELRHAGYRRDRRLRGEARVRPWSGWMSVAGVVTPYERDQLRFIAPPRPAPHSSQ